MGIQRTLHIWPARVTAPKRGALLRLAKALLDAKLVAEPCMLVIGEIAASPGFWLHDTAYVNGQWQKVPLQCHGIDAAKQRLVYEGYSAAELLAAIAANEPAPDACVVLDCFGSNKQLAKVQKKRGFYGATVSLLELGEAKPFITYNMYAEDGDGDAGEHQARRLVVVDGKGGPESLVGTPFWPILQELFGKPLKSSCTQS